MKHILKTIKELLTIKIEYLPIAALMLGLIFEISSYTDNIAKFIAIYSDGLFFNYTSGDQIDIVYMFILVSIIAPITEEIFKYSAKSFGMLQEFIFVLCCYEFSFYVMIGTNAGLNIYKLIIVRLLAVMLHYVTGLIITEGFEKDRKKLYLCFAIVGHMLFNSIGFLSSSNFNSIN